MTDRGESFALLLPGLLLLGLAFLLPIFYVLSLAFEGEAGTGLGNFARFLGDAYYLQVAWRTIRLSLIITLISALIGFPYAYIAARAGRSLRLWLIVLLVLPLMTSVVVRTFGWMVLLTRNGLVPDVFRALGLAGRNFTLMQTEYAIVVGLVQVLLPFMTLSILGVVMKIDTRLEEAARTMGCTFLQTLRTVVLPLALPGIVAGSLLVFTLSVSSFVTPSLLGGVRIPVIAASIYDQVTQTLDWPFAAAQSTILLVGILLILAPYMKVTSR